MKPCIVWQTDFSLKWGAVASMRGVCKQVDPTLECVDITHEIEPYNIMAGSREIAYVEPFWPKGTIFVSVVDPGVGTSRKACCAKLSDGNYVITPDNGTLTHLYYFVGIEAVREIDETVNRYKGTEEVSVFHGRDLFAYTAAKLASGIIDFEGVGPAYPVEDIIVFPKKLVIADIEGDTAKGIVASVGDPFGSIVFNISVKDFVKAGFQHGDMVHVLLQHKGETVYEQEVLYHKSFGFVPEGEPIIFNSSSTYVSLGLNMDSFRDKYGIRAGEDWDITLTNTGKKVEVHA